MILKRAVLLLMLAAVFPFIIGHGGCLYGPEDSCLIGCIDDRCEPVCGDAEDELNCDSTYIVSGGRDPETPLRGSGSTKFVSTNPDHVSSAGDPGSEVTFSSHALTYDDDGFAQPFNFEYNNDHYFYVIERPVNNDAAAGQIWIHGDHFSIKLIHSRVNGPPFDNAFLLHRVTTSTLQSNVVAATSGYTVSGHASGSIGVTVDRLEIYVNADPINIPGTGRQFQPVMFDARRGDRIRLVAADTDASQDSDISSIWLHTPDGRGIKVAAGLISTDRDTAEIDVTVIAE